MKVLLCAIGRLENAYIREWVEYNKNIGFTNIVLYDNNRDGEERFEDVIGDYIDSGFVILKDYRNRQQCQLQAYKECYEQYNKEYDWIAFFDCDEFLTLTKAKSVGDYLSALYFKRYDMIHVNWMCYGDNDLLVNDGRPVLERLTQPIPFDKKIAYNIPEDYHVKSIIRGGLNKNFEYRANPHSPHSISKCCNNRGIACDGESPFVKFNASEAYIRHFSTKTITEYCEKMKKGFPDQLWDGSLIKMLLETRFFRYNTVTQEKLDIVKDMLGIDLGLKPEVHETEYHGELVNGKRKDVQLFMLCYDNKDYGFVDNEVMTPLQCGAVNGKDICKLKDNVGDNISSSNFCFAENTGIYWIWKNIKDAKYKGQTQYRRRLEGINEKTDYEGIFKNYDIICAKPYNYPANHSAFIPSDTVLGGYGYSHCQDDLVCLGEIVKEHYPEYSEDWERVIVNGQNLYYSNGFVLPSEKYDEFCTFAFDLYSKWLEKNKIERYEDLIIHVARNVERDKYIRYPIEGRSKDELTFGDYRYQMRIIAYLAERVFTLWLEHNIPQERRYEVDYEKMENNMFI